MNQIDYILDQQPGFYTEPFFGTFAMNQPVLTVTDPALIRLILEDNRSRFVELDDQEDYSVNLEYGFLATGGIRRQRSAVDWIKLDKRLEQGKKWLALYLASITSLASLTFLAYLIILDT